MNAAPSCSWRPADWDARQGHPLTRLPALSPRGDAPHQRQYAHLKLIDALLPGRSLNTTTPSRSISMVPFRMLRSFAFTVMASVGNHE